MLPEDFVFIFTYLKDVPGIVCENETVRYRERHSLCCDLINQHPYEQVRGGVGSDDLDWDLHLHPSIPCQEETG